MSLKKIYQSIRQWFTNNGEKPSDLQALPNKINWVRAIPFILLNLSCLFVIWTGVSWTAVIIAVILCYIRIFSIGAFYHRYFSHRTFKTNRFWQCIFAILGATAMQRGPLWWAGQHRKHHTVADQINDAHSPVHHGFLWSHIGWFLSDQNYYTDTTYLSDLTRYPELRFLDRYDVVVPLFFGMGLFGLGVLLEKYAPSLKTNGWQLLVWGFSISTITVSINSISHLFGKRPFNTKDNSHNHWFLALLTLGEGWHNNHHHYPSSIRQGFTFWQIDITYYILCLFKKLGIIWDVKLPPKHIL
jgi:stearoyl-CoA desaturase (delta-9 desaturase)